MFDQILGLPAHPLMVHAPVVLIPLTVLVALVYSLLPPLRARLGRILVLLSLAGAGSAFAATESGKAFASHQQTSAQLNQHGNFGENVRNFAALLAVVAILLVVVDMSRRRRSRGSYIEEIDDQGYRYQPPRSGGLVMGAVSLILTLGLLGAAGTAGYYVVETGHTGAKMVWGSRLQ